MPWPPRFLFIAQRLCLDFALTGGEGWRSQFERWQAPSDLADWLWASSLTLEVPTVTARQLERAKELREALWSAAQSAIRDRAPTPKVREVINRVAAWPDLVPVLEARRKRWSPDQAVDRALSTIARDAIDLFGSPLRERIRECANPNCPLIFLDTSRPGRRAWCAMRRCGNLSKTARYRAKQRSKEPRS
ncbi:MAG: CGNR zinc finger domain-containing protein [Planctomycetota bacterium]